MNFDFLKNNNMALAIPSRQDAVIEPTFTITYTEKDIRRICKQHINNNFNLEIDEDDFHVESYIDYDLEGYEVRYFDCEIKEDAINNEEFENLEKHGYLFDNNILEVILGKEFKNPKFLNINTYLGVDGQLFICASMPLEHYDFLKKGKTE